MYEQGYESNAFGYAPGYDPYGGPASRWGADEPDPTDLDGGEEEGFFARMIETVRGYAASVAGNRMITIGAGVAAGTYQFLVNDADWVDAAAWGLIAGGALHAASTLIAGGFEALSSTSFWFGAAFIASGYAAPMILDAVQEKTGFGFGNYYSSGYL